MLTDKQIQELIERPYKQPAAIATIAADLADETIGFLHGKVSAECWAEIMAVLEEAATIELSKASTTFAPSRNTRKGSSNEPLANPIRPRAATTHHPRPQSPPIGRSAKVPPHRQAASSGAPDPP